MSGALRNQRRDVLHEEATALFKAFTDGRRCSRGWDDTWRKHLRARVTGPRHSPRLPKSEFRTADLASSPAPHYTSLAVRSGVVLLVLARDLGHSDTSMVEKHYGHLADEYVREQMRGMH